MFATPDPSVSALPTEFPFRENEIDSFDTGLPLASSVADTLAVPP
jgi:hypothetical protein